MKIAILGFGVEGKSAYEYFRKINPENEIDIFDEREVDGSVVKITTVKSFTNVDYSSYDTIVRSPSVPPKAIEQKIISDKNGEKDFEFSSVTQIFFDRCPAPIIGVTGTKGKGSTASFIYEILKASFAGFASTRNVYLVGNIGVPSLDILPDVTENDVVVYELSSFQLWDLKRKSPHVAVFTNLEPDHLEVHEDFAEYKQAKLNIFKYQTDDDWAVIHKSLSDLSLQAKVLEFPDDSLEPIVRKSIKIAGNHQVENAEAAIMAARAIEPEITDNQVVEGLRNFTGLPHRLKFVAEKNGVQYYDDSIATTPGSAIAAIKSFDQPKILILGGFDKGADYTEIGEIAQQRNVREIFVIGSNQDKVATQVGKSFQGKITQISSKNMDDIIDTISKNAELGDIVIMSPAAASFDMFKNYKDRGEKFITAVEKLKSI
jgi:UDP-N-acetylmuramoylalanine--D-glutamate ligase